MPVTAPFLRRVPSPTGGTMLVDPRETEFIQHAYDTHQQKVRQPYEDRLQIQSLLASQNQAAFERQSAERQAALDLAQRQREFGARLELDQRGQFLAEERAKADALLRNRGLQLDWERGDTASRLATRKQDFLESQPNELELMRAKFDLEQKFASEGGLLPHQAGERLAQTTKLVEGQVAGIREAMNDAPLTTEGQRVWGELSGELRAIESQRDLLRPQQYNDLVNQWLAKVERSNLKSHIKPPPTAGDVIGQQYDPETGIFVQQDSQGRWQARPLLSAADQRREIDLKEKELEWKMRTEGGGGDVMSQEIKSLADVYADKDTLQRFQQQAREAIMARRNTAALNSDKPPSEEISAKELFEEVQKQFQQEQEFSRLMLGEVAKQSPSGRTPEQSERLRQYLQKTVPQWMPGNPGQPATMQPSEDDIMSPSDTGPVQPPVTMPTQAEPFAEVSFAAPEPIVAAYQQRVAQTNESADTGIGYLRRVLRTNHMQGDGSQFLTARAVEMAQSLGKDPLEYAAKNAADAIREGREKFHWGTMPKMEKQYHEMLGTPTIPLEGKELDAALRTLPPGAFYFDSNLNLRQKPKAAKQTDDKVFREAMPDKYRFPGIP